MNDTQKIIAIFENLPRYISSKLSMREIFEILSIMLEINESEIFEPTTEDFLNAMAIRIKIQQGIKDIKNKNVYSTNELKKELGI